MKKNPDLRLLAIVFGTFFLVATIGIMIENYNESKGTHLCNPVLCHVDLTDPSAGLELETGGLEREVNEAQEARDRANGDRNPFEDMS